MVCHEPTRTTMRNVDAPITGVDAAIEQTMALGRLTNPAIRCVGVVLNTTVGAGHRVGRRGRMSVPPVAPTCQLPAYRPHVAYVLVTTLLVVEHVAEGQERNISTEDSGLEPAFPRRLEV